ncbi:MAG: type III secretion system chaperone [Mailhella sp.]|nr:type III secretion system chaperone [Mailhella sp.]
MNQHFAALMKDLFALAGADEAECFEEDVALLSVNGFDISLTFLEGADQILASTVVSELPAGSLHKLQARLLEGNVFFQETQGFTLGAREDTGVVLQAVLPCAVLDASALAALVSNLAAVAEHWRGVCEELADSQPEEEATPFSVGGTDMLWI